MCIYRLIVPVMVTLSILVVHDDALAQAVDSPPTTPAGLTARAYSATSGGIAWQRSTDDRGVRGYEVKKNGTVIDIRDALSYIDSELVAGTSTTYTVTAIDTKGQRSGRATVVLTTPDARPGQPRGLTARLYSATAVGLSWDRSGVLGERYEVKRDGEVVANTDGTTHIDRSLIKRRRYEFTVTAINRQGLRSIDTSLDVVTSYGSPDTPAGLRATVYSPTAAGIAWDEPPPPITYQDVVTYEVSRDGELVARSGGRSYIDDLLTGGATYVYSIVAINWRAERSRPSTISVTTPVGSSPTYSEAPVHVQERLSVVLDIMTGDAIRAAIRQGKGVFRQLGSEQYPQTATTVTPGTLLGRTEYRCKEGGVAATRRYEIDGANDNPQTQFLLEDCESDFAFSNATYDGGTMEEIRLDYPANGIPPAYIDSDIGLPDEISRFQSRDNIGGDYTFDVTGFLRVDLNVAVGRFLTHVQQIGTESNPMRETTSVGGDGTTTTVTRRDDGESFDSETSVDLVLRLSDVVGDVTATTPMPLYKNTARRTAPTRGQLLVTGPDFSYLLDADTNNERTYYVTVTENGSTMTYAALWNGQGIDSRPL